MKPNLILFTSLYVVGVVLDVQAGECSDATLEGDYGAYGVGTLVPAGTPFRSLARITFDGQGNWSNSFTQNDNGTIIRGTQSATYEVNPDCTGTFFGSAGQPIFDLVVVEGGKEFYALRVDPANRVLTLIGKKLTSKDSGDQQ